MDGAALEHATNDRTSPIPNGEFPFTWSDFRKIAALVHAQAGIVLAENKVNLVYSRLAKRLRAIRLENFRDYCELIESEAGGEERQAMISAMTTNVTRFFREPHHFEHLRDNVLPDLQQKARAGGRVRIWSAGCSSGEEPYSIALTILGQMPNVQDYDVLILASDIDHTMIAHGRAALYDPRQIENIPAELRRSGLERVGDKSSLSYRMTPAVRDLVRFNELNLLDPWPMKGSFDVIFCRNTMIYFDEATQNGIWKRFAEIMTPGATLFVGHSERIAVDLLPFELVAQTSYRLWQGGRK